MQFYSRKYLFHIRVLTRIILVVFIGFKTINVVHAITSSLKKEVFESNEGSDDETQKKTEKAADEKEKEFAVLNVVDDHQHFIEITSAHNCNYSIHYKSRYFVNITIPPPDVCLNLSI